MVMVEEMGRWEGVIWGRWTLGFGWDLGWVLMGELLFGEWCFRWYFIGIFV